MAFEAGLEAQRIHKILPADLPALQIARTDELQDALARDAQQGGGTRDRFHHPGQLVQEGLPLSDQDLPLRDRCDDCCDSRAPARVSVIALTALLRS